MSMVHLEAGDIVYQVYAWFVDFVTWRRAMHAVRTNFAAHMSCRTAVI